MAETQDVQYLTAHFHNLALPQDAASWLIELYRLIQVFDDFADGDNVSRSDLDAAIMASLVLMPANPFFQAHSSWLLPALMQAVLKWQASDIVEKRGEADARSFMWRAGFYDVVCLVTSLVHGPSSLRALQALSLYGEKFEDYQKEFPHA